jgi:hypothetical protein
MPCTFLYLPSLVNVLIRRTWSGCCWCEQRRRLSHLGARLSALRIATWDFACLLPPRRWLQVQFRTCASLSTPFETRSDLIRHKIQPTALTRSPLDNSALSPPRQPYVQPSYYAAIIAAEAIGNSGNTRVIELSTSDQWISGYAFYEDDKLTKAVFINSRAYLSSEDSRSQVSINLGFDASVSGLVTLKRLSIP